MSAVRYSIITISYNAEKVIAKTIQSVLKQTGNDYEYLLIDGDSKDATNDVIKTFIPLFQEKGIKVIHCSEPDKGISDAFNKGVLAASGDIIGIINAGDMLTDNAIEILNNEFDDETDVLYGNMLWVDDENKLQYIRKSKSMRTTAYEMCALHPATFIKKRAYEKIGLYRLDFKISMDRELLTRMYKNGLRFKKINDVLAIMEAGGVSDQPEKRMRKKQEAYIIAEENGIPKIRIRFFLSYQAIKDNIKSLIKKLRVYELITRKCT